ncbi:DnaJ domain-containing protein [Dioscorea alata]|uniref:DnaJ domain-containing protein n=1 Tax=Dioscorea alata TaxID=55571 RepID=A0ACB7WPM4_DIOAL|nr:DnaJ domain-containing protein [Dioscorea alata]
MAKIQDSAEFVDHYLMLCLPSGEESFKISLKQIDKAFREQSRKHHPDKRPNDPEATADFQRLIKSYKILTDVSARAAFDASIREKAFRASCFDAKRRKLISDLEEREHAMKIDPTEIAAMKEKIVAAELKKELAAFQSHKVKKSTFVPVPSTSVTTTMLSVRHNELSSVVRFEDYELSVLKKLEKNFEKI